MFWVVDGRISPRLQGDIGERAAAIWLLSQPRIDVFIPFGHNPDADLIADIDGRLVRVQVKTSALHVKNGRYQVSLATRGGNQSWNRIVKRFSSTRCEYLFVLIEDGRQWFIPSTAVEGSTSIIVGGPKYAAFEVARGRPFDVMKAA